MKIRIGNVRNNITRRFLILILAPPLLLLYVGLNVFDDLIHHNKDWAIEYFTEFMNEVKRSWKGYKK